jgi:hypothetical protein
MDSRVFKLVLLGGALALCSCGEERKPTFDTKAPVFQVKGQVLVNGKPGKGVTIRLYPKAAAEQGVEPTDPSVLLGLAGKDGEPIFTTYEAGDGVPAGDYVATFELKELTKTRGEKEYGPDKLGDKYSDPAKSQVEVAVGEGKKNDIGKVELEEAAETPPAN